MKNRSRSPQRRWWMLAVMVIATALSSAETCTSPSEPHRESRCDFINADNRQSCDATASRNGCRNHAFTELTNVCTGFECNSCDR
jgi:hypothetical protein